MSQPLIVLAGMHRSGTSFTANVLRRAGLGFGQRLVGATPANPDGHFEHEPMVAFHDAVLGARDGSWFDVPMPTTLEWDIQEKAAACSLLAEARDEGVGVVKDPRATLFLEQWAAAIPEARFVLLWRDAAEVCDSLKRRDDSGLHRKVLFGPQLRRLGVDTFDASRAVGLWCRYNEALVDFASSQPTRCVVLNIRAVRERFEVLAGALEAWGVRLGVVDVEAVLRPDRLRAEPARACRRASATNRVTALATRLASLERSTISDGNGL